MFQIQDGIHTIFVLSNVGGIIQIAHFVVVARRRCHDPGLEFIDITDQRFRTLVNDFSSVIEWLNLFLVLQVLGLQCRRGFIHFGVECSLRVAQAVFDFNESVKDFF